MKRPLFYILTGIMMSVTSIAWSQSDQPACYDWVQISSYRLGTFGDNDKVFGGERINGTDKQYNRTDFREAQESAHGLCQFHATNAGNSAALAFPRQKREIQIYFQKQLDNCQQHFTSKYNNLAKQLCDQD